MVVTGCCFVAQECMTSYGTNDHQYQQLNLEFLKHLANSPALLPYDFHLFGPLKNALRSCQFADDEVKEAVHNWLHNQSKNFFQWHQEACRSLG
jgi:hypothetical protein